MGAMAAAPNRFWVLSTDEATAPSPRKMGESSIIRVSFTVSSVLAASKPGTSHGTSSGAKMATKTENTTSAMSIRLMTVDVTRQARDGWPPTSRPDSTGTSAEAMAPAATSW